MQNISNPSLASINGGLLIDLEYILNGGTFPDYDREDFIPTIFKQG